MQISVATVENNMEFLQKMKNGSILRASDFISRDLSKETQNTNLKEFMHPLHPFQHYV